MRTRAGARRSFRVAVAAALATGAVLAARTFARRRRLEGPVAPDLRTPLMHLIPPVASSTVLRIMRALPMPDVGLAAGVEVTTETIHGHDGHDIRVLVYDRPDASREDERDQPRGALLWIHGGGLLFGAPEQCHQICSRWASELGLLVVSVDYRVAPEHPFPAALDDCYAALEWMLERAEAFGIDVERIAVGGESAGGGLAASVCQVARDRSGPPVRFQLLEYPMLDDRTTLESDHGNRGVFLWTPKSNTFGWTAYLGREPVHDLAPRYAAAGRTTNLAGLPPAWIGVGELDLFLTEDLAYADALQAAGVSCDVEVVPGMYHGADSVLVKAPTCVAFRDSMTRALAAGLDVPAPD